MAALVTPALPLLALPDPIAVHWSGSGAPDGATPRLVAALAPAAIWATGWWLLARNGFHRSAVRTGFTVGGILAAAQATVVFSNLHAPSWREASRLSPLLVAGPVLAGLALGWLASRLTADRAKRDPVPQLRPQAAESAEPMVWVGTAVNRAAWAIPTLILLPATVTLLGQGGDGAPVGRLVLGAVPLLAIDLLFSAVRVVVGPRAVVAGLGPWGLPRRRIDIGQIRSATTEQVQPLDRGGWGWRTGPSGTSVIIRTGEALVLHLRDGGRFAVTVDRASDAAAIVNGYLAGP